MCVKVSSSKCYYITDLHHTIQLDGQKVQVIRNSSGNHGCAREYFNLGNEQIARSIRDDTRDIWSDGQADWAIRTDHSSDAHKKCSFFWQNLEFICWKLYQKLKSWTSHWGNTKILAVSAHVSRERDNGTEYSSSPWLYRVSGTFSSITDFYEQALCRLAVLLPNYSIHS